MEIENSRYSLTYAVKGQDIYLVNVDAHEPGGGTDAFRQLFQIRKDQNLSGDIFLHTHGGEPNLFYFYMGMVPYEADQTTNQRVPYTETRIKEELIPSILKDMRENLETGEKRINLSGGGQAFMMTKAGFQRAKEAIAKNEEIKPFKMFEHLPLTDDQKKELEQIMEAKNQLLSAQENTSGRKNKI